MECEKAKVRRLYDIANVLSTISLITKVIDPSYRGPRPAFQYIGPRTEIIHHAENVVDFINSENTKSNSKHSLFDHFKRNLFLNCTIPRFDPRNGLLGLKGALDIAGRGNGGATATGTYSMTLGDNKRSPSVSDMMLSSSQNSSNNGLYIPESKKKRHSRRKQKSTVVPIVEYDKTSTSVPQPPNLALNPAYLSHLQFTPHHYNPFSTSNQTQGTSTPNGTMLFSNYNSPTDPQQILSYHHLLSTTGETGLDAQSVDPSTYFIPSPITGDSCQQHRDETYTSTNGSDKYNFNEDRDSEQMTISSLETKQRRNAGIRRHQTRNKKFTTSKMKTKTEQKDLIESPSNLIQQSESNSLLESCHYIQVVQQQQQDQQLFSQQQSTQEENGGETTGASEQTQSSVVHHVTGRNPHDLQDINVDLLTYQVRSVLPSISNGNNNSIISGTQVIIEKQEILTDLQSHQPQSQQIYHSQNYHPYHSWSTDLYSTDAQHYYSQQHAMCTTDNDDEILGQSGTVVTHLQTYGEHLLPSINTFVLGKMGH
ncbi:unnamed protein product [Didymodactylos carnosus]|uniref:E2F/DP family winged-helix DNA-binding domain-containing protein n=1 Tax=Didymodactylos carnosus TaxID=1234261 RepID=A0A8S2J946_9BILA|nr:unnamed protein product [Didymodactylos carnosus]CAF3798797.1 unnamed protein product [Didymodactylos carnosus]